MRIVGGDFRGRPIEYDGDRSTRPMKDRLREAVFNLIGPAVRGRQVIDLFSGTGAMALEALSRGAVSAISVERRFPAARTIERNASALGTEDRVTVVASNVFAWWRKADLPPQPAWLTFCCPPYALYEEQAGEMVQLITEVLDRAPSGSLTVLEFDARFAAESLPDSNKWDVRRYPPAFIAVHESG